jgi:large subunit ribosomal protein L13e
LANVSKVEARNIGISVDHRRRNKSKESIAQNVERIKLYKSKVVVLGKKQKTADFEQLKGKLLPLVKAAPTDVSRKVVGESNAYKTLQKARLDKKYRGARLEKARKEAEEEANKKK